MSIGTNNLPKGTPISVDDIFRYPDHYPECPDQQVRSFRAYTRSFPRSVLNLEYPGLYPEYPGFAQLSPPKLKF